MNGGGCWGVGQDVDEVWIYHVIVKQVKDAHPIRSICKEKHMQRAHCFDSNLTTFMIRHLCQDVEVMPCFQNIPGLMGLKLMSIGSEVLVLTCTMAEVGNTRMCVQDVS